MGYLYENSTDQTFQRFVQTLLLPEYPGLQCFPIGQRDGGRDGMHRGTQTILQVKFRRKDEATSAEQIIRILEDEKPKVEQLAIMGARSYVFVTNAYPSAHLKTGSIDKVQQWLDSNLSVSAVCLWRDDLDRRFETAPVSLKFTYANMLTGQDGIHLALSAALQNETKQRQLALRSFVAKQYQDDEIVKFRQVDMSNSLLGLFIDVPIQITPDVWSHMKRMDISPADLTTVGSVSGGNFTLHPQLGSETELLDSNHGERVTIGAAGLLLSDIAQTRANSIILQGAPGQGKSTLAQYVCQVHRAAFLNRLEFLDNIPDEHKAHGFRVPIKVDLRDLATYLEGKEPFEPAKRLKRSAESLKNSYRD